MTGSHTKPFTVRNHLYSLTVEPPGLHCFVSHFPHKKRCNYKSLHFTGLKHVLLQIAISYTTKMKSNKHKTYFFQYACTTQLLDTWR